MNYVTIRLMKQPEVFTQEVVYKSDLSTAQWELHSVDPQDEPFAPNQVAICPQSELCVRTGKIHAHFRHDLLVKMRDFQSIVCNMLLFHCTICNERFVSFHPEHLPPFKLEVLKQYPWKVHEWETQPGPEKNIACWLSQRQV